MKNINKVLWGLSFIVAGVLIGTNSLGITDINIFFKGWWTLFIIVPSFIGLFDRNDKILGNLITLIIGFLLLLSIRGVIDFNILSNLIIPFIFIFIGFYILFNNTVKYKISKKIANKIKDDENKIFVTFAEEKINKNNEKFNAANIDVVFGSVNLDLRKAKLDKEVMIKSSAIFGSNKILVPKNVNVKIKSTPIFGGVKNSIINNKENKTTIYIYSLCLFGGLEIK